MFGFRLLNDRTLIQLMRSGNEEALTVLYARAFKKVYRYVITKQGKIKDAEEVLTEALLAVWQHVIRQKNGQPFALAPYVLAAARNRWNKRDRKKGKKEPDAGNKQSYSASLLKESWLSLPENDRKLLGYYYFDGFSLKEIAELTGAHSPDAVKQRKSEILKHLIEKTTTKF